MTLKCFPRQPIISHQCFFFRYPNPQHNAGGAGIVNCATHRHNLHTIAPQVLRPIDHAIRDPLRVRLSFPGWNLRSASIILT